MKRREFLASAAMTLAARSLHGLPWQAGKAASAAGGAKADHSLRIEPCTIEIGHGVTVKTVAFNGQVPGPLLKLREGVPVTIDVMNATENPDITHWHGLAIDTLND